MKRIRSFDLLRGLAIVAMVLIHRIIWDYVRQNPEADVTALSFLIFTLFTNMAGIFFCISGAVNSYVNVNRLRKGQVTSRQVLFKSFSAGIILIFLSLLFRYFLLRTTDNVVSYIPGTDTIQYWNETGVLPYMVLYGVYPAKFNIFVLFHMGTLSMIGYSIISVSGALVLYHKRKGFDDSSGLRRYFLIIGIAIFLASGLTYRYLFGPVEQAVNGGNILAGIFLSPLFIGKFSVFPHLAYGFFGAYFGVAFAIMDTQPRMVLRSMLRFWAVLLSIGVAILAVCIPLGIFNTWYSAWGQKLFQLGFYFLLFWLGMKFIDYQPDETRDSRMKWLAPLVTIGRLTLTIFILEGVLSVSLQRLIAPVWPDWNASAGNATLFGLINLAVWGVIIIVWKRFNFAGSVEWTSAWLVRRISGQKSSKMDDIQAESVVERG
jgi:surface polysaccharide O-acyltransferase-like enzyme